MSLFVLDMKTPGITLKQLNIQVETAERQYMVFFDNVKVAADGLIGETLDGRYRVLERLAGDQALARAADRAVGIAHDRVAASEHPRGVEMAQRRAARGRTRNR